MTHQSTLYCDIKDFVYITIKLQARMHDASDESFYSVHNTVERINSYLFARVSDSTKEYAEPMMKAISAGFERLKDEENIPIVCYETIEQLTHLLDKRFNERSAS